MIHVVRFYFFNARGSGELCTVGGGGGKLIVSDTKCLEIIIMIGGVKIIRMANLD